MNKSFFLLSKWTKPFRNSPFDGECPDFLVALFSPQYAVNVGCVLRNCGILGGASVILTGSNYSERFCKDSLRIAMMSKNQLFVNLSIFEDTLELINILKKKKYRICALENIETSDNICNIKNLNKVLLIVGKEDTGIPQEILEKCDFLIKIPTLPNQPSLNLSHAATVFAWERFRRVYYPQGGEQTNPQGGEETKPQGADQTTPELIEEK
eukprot:GHVL01018233.1.p1 GENE.GHVL01018233.1~~GHVL01018233.1.p1  ORF type:complete len:211 (-),score=59.85 GHVL01018233.1:807-1439(-)